MTIRSDLAETAYVDEARIRGPRLRQGGRLLTALVGEAGQAAFHFFLNLVLIRTLVAEAYGIFVVIFMLASIGITYMQALVGTPIGVTVPRHRGAGAAAWEVAFGSAAVVQATIVGFLVAVISVFWFNQIGVAILGGAFAAVWFLRGFVRAALFARHQPFRAGISDISFLVAGVSLGGVALAFDALDPLTEAFAVLVAAHAVALAVAAADLRMRVTLRARLWRRYLGLWPALSWSVAGVTSANVQAQGQMLLVAAIAGPAAYAPIAACMILFAPLRIFGTAIFNLTQPVYARLIIQGNGGQVRRLLLLSGAGVALAGIILGAFLFAIFGPLQALLFGRQFADQPMGFIAVLAWAIVTLAQVYSCASSMLLGAHAFRFVALVNVVSGAIGLLCIAGLLYTIGPIQSLFGAVVSELIALLLFWGGALRHLPLGKRNATGAARISAA